MSITNVKPNYDLGDSTDYLVFGMGAKKRKHKAAGTNRIVPGFYCDAPNIQAFVNLGRELAGKHSRKVMAQSYVMSFSPEEFSVNDPRDLQRVGDAAFLLAKKMHPHSPCLIVVHADGKGHAAHAHIKVLNHDSSTGKALRDFRVHWQVKKANDELMQELDLRVLEAEPKQPKNAWSKRRSEMAPFEQKMGDLCAEAKIEALTQTLSEATPTVARFTARFAASCRARGIELVIDDFEIKSSNRRGKQEGESALGFTFKMRDEGGPKPRVRRRKASSLSSEFTHDAIAREVTSAALTASKGLVASPAPVSPASEPWTLETTAFKQDFRGEARNARPLDEVRTSAIAALTAMRNESQVLAHERMRRALLEREAEPQPKLRHESLPCRDAQANSKVSEQNPTVPLIREDAESGVSAQVGEALASPEQSATAGPAKDNTTTLPNAPRQTHTEDAQLVAARKDLTRKKLLQRELQRTLAKRGLPANELGIER